MAEIGKEYKIFNVKFPPPRFDGTNAYLAATGLGVSPDTDAIQQAIDSLSAFRNRRPQFDATLAFDVLHKRGGIVYFPPGKYLITPSVPPIAVTSPSDLTANAPIGFPNYVANRKHGGSLFVPEDVTLQFAPGAILLLKPAEESAPPFTVTARIEIEGRIDAGLYQIFDAWYPTRDTGMGLTEDRSKSGAVILSSLRIPEVFPECWGAFADGGPRGFNSYWRPIQDALNAAFRDRTSLKILDPMDISTGRFAKYPPITVRLSGTYKVDRPLIVEGDPNSQSDDGSGFRLVGSQAVGGASVGKPSLVSGFTTGALRFAQDQGIPLALFFVKKAFGFSIENVGFVTQIEPTANPSDHVRTGVWVEAGVRTSGSSGTQNSDVTTGAIQMGRFQRCSFSSAPTTVSLRELVHLGGGVGNPPRGRYDGAVPDDDRDRGVVYGDDLLGLTFEQCVFHLQDGGTVGSGIDGPDPRRYVGLDNARGVVVNAANALPVQFNTCQFAGYAKRLVAAVGGEVYLNGTGFHNTNLAGVDVFIERPGDVVPYVVPPVGMTITHCESQSWSFLASYAGTAVSSAVANVTIMACNHSNVQMGYLDDADGLLGLPGGRIARGLRAGEPPSIDWHNGGALTLIGCSFSSDVRIGAEAAVVTDIGTTFSATRGGSPGALVPGGRFSDNLKPLRGVTGLPSWRGAATTGGRLTDPCLHVGDSLLAMTSSLTRSDYPWQTGDVWMQPPTSGLAADATTNLGSTLHKAYQTRKLVAPASLPAGSRYTPRTPAGTSVTHARWENIFGSENYSGPWFAFWDREYAYFDGVVPIGRLTLDSLVVPESGAVYELLWNVHPWLNGYTSPDLRAAGRATITVSCRGIGPVQPYTRLGTRITVALVEHGSGSDAGVGHFTDAIDLPLEVKPGVALVRASTFDPEADAVPFEDREGYRLRLSFLNVWGAPWLGGVDYFSASLRRVL